MKSRKLWVGLPVILVFAVVLGVILTSCDEPLAEDEIVAIWYTDQEAANDGSVMPAFEFLSNKELQTYESDGKGGTKKTKYSVEITGAKVVLKVGGGGGNPLGEYTMNVVGTELTVKGNGGPIKASSSGIKYYKKGATYVPVATPTASTPGGVFTTANAPTVTLTTTPVDATIKYTIDGKDPMDGTVYTAPISITQTTVLRAIANKGEIWSEELNETYIIGGTATTGNSVTDGGDSADTSGTLRNVLASADDNATITIQDNLTITLTQCLYIRKNVTIKGKGVTITKGTGNFSGSGSFIEISEGKEVTFSGIHFKGARELNAKYGLGGAIYNIGTLTVESCIFNDNQAIWGGAIYSTSKSKSTTVKGCTFYKNNATSNGGAMYISGGSLYMTGNLFYQNTVGTGGWGPIVDYANGRGKIYSRGYNVIDKAYGTGSQDSGWMNDEKDETRSTAFINTSTFASIGLDSISVPSTVTGGFPTTDYNGAARNGRPGAVN